MSIWSSLAAHAAKSTLGSTPSAPSPGGGAAAKFQSILQGAGKQGQAGLSPMANTAAANPMASSGSSGSSSDSEAAISANDFLTLLVTEMQNQDPTADVDPNEYINQLVQINSLEQLISINQNLTTVLDAASSTPPASGKVSPSGVNGSAASQVQSARAASQPITARGNLSSPGAAPAAHTVGHALDGHARAAPHGHAIRNIPTRALP